MVRVTSNAGAGWTKPAVIPAGTGMLKDVTLTPTLWGGVMVGWVQVLQPGNYSICESRQEIELSHRSWLPLITRR